MKQKRVAVSALVVAVGVAAAVIGFQARHASASPQPKVEKQSATANLDQSASDPAFGAFLGACNTDGDCANGNVCMSFRKRGTHCTHPCADVADCGGGAAARCTKQNRCGLNEPVKTEKP